MNRAGPPEKKAARAERNFQPGPKNQKPATQVHDVALRVKNPPPWLPRAGGRRR